MTLFLLKGEECDFKRDKVFKNQRLRPCSKGHVANSRYFYVWILSVILAVSLLTQKTGRRLSAVNTSSSRCDQMRRWPTKSLVENYSHEGQGCQKPDGTI